MSYNRVIPRDLFNEGKLLKCMGRLILLILDGRTPVKMGYDEIDEPFEIELLDEGSLTISNLDVSIKKKKVIFKTTYNSKEPYPLFCGQDETESIEVLTDEGEFTEEFITYCKQL